MRLRWSVAFLVMTAASVGYAQLPSTTTVEAPAFSSGNVSGFDLTNSFQALADSSLEIFDSIAERISFSGMAAAA